MSRSRTRVTLLLLLTFAAGMAAGVAADRHFAAGPETPKQVEEDHRRDRRGGGATIERFADELGLTTEQRERIDPILEDMRERMSDLFEPVRPAYRELVDSTRVRIEAILTPEQVTDYRELLDRTYGSDREGRERDRDGDARRDTTERDTEN